MTDKCFRVLLDLTDLQEQSFKYVWINVSPRELKTISDFERSILNKLNLKQNSIELFVRDGLLLDEETILVLREDDTVKVQYKKQHSDFTNCNDEFGKSCRKRNLSENSIESISTHCKRHKSESECFKINNEEKQPRKKKNKKSQTLNLNMQEDYLTVLEESSTTKIKKSKDKEKSSAQLDHDIHTRKDDPFFSFDVTEPLLTKQNETVKHSSLKRNKTTSMKFTFPEADKEIESSSTSLLNKNKTDCHGSEKGYKNEVSGEIAIENKNSDKQDCILAKKKRKRRRKRKDKLMLPVDIPDETRANIELKSFSNSIDVKDKRKHIIYSTSPNRTKEDNNSSNALPSYSDTFNVKEKNIRSNNQPVFNYPKVSTPAQSNNCSNPNWCVSLMQSKKHSNDKISDSKTKLDESNEQLSQEKVKFSFFDNSNVSQNSNIVNAQTSNIHEDEHSLGESYFAQNNKLAKQNQSFLTERKDTSNIQNGSASCDFTVDGKSIEKNCTSDKKCKTSDKNYEDFPTLRILPQVGTHIAYKTLELDENYSPVISDYREGIVKSVNLKTEELEIELIKEIVKPGRTGKFENLDDDEIPSPEVITCDMTRWSSIISPKCLS